MTFLHKRVEEGNGTFGSHLRDLRDLQKMTLEAASRDTKIRDTILSALEEDRMSDLDDPVFVERHLIAYVRYLGGHEPYFLARYRERLKDLHAAHQVKDMLPRTRGVKWRDLFVGPQILAAAGVLLLGLVFGGYVLWQAHLVGTPPPLAVMSPQDGERLAHPIIEVHGMTSSEATVTINGKDAPVDGNGAFTLPLDVRRGTTVITIVAHRRRGSEATVERRVVYDAALSEMDVSGMATSTTATSTK